MTVKTTGEEWNRFYNDKEYWPPESWHDDEEITVDGTLTTAEWELGKIDPTSSVVLTCGHVMLSGLDDAESISFETFFKRWRKKQSTTILTVEVANEFADSVRQAIFEAGGKVVFNSK